MLGSYRSAVPGRGSLQQESLILATLKKFTTGVFVYGVKLGFDLVLPHIWVVFLAFPFSANRCNKLESSALAPCRAAEAVSACNAGGIPPPSNVLMGPTTSPSDQGSSKEGRLATSIWENNLVNQIMVF